MTKKKKSVAVKGKSALENRIEALERAVKVETNWESMSLSSIYFGGNRERLVGADVHRLCGQVKSLRADLDALLDHFNFVPVTKPERHVISSKTKEAEEAE